MDILLDPHTFETLELIHRDPFDRILIAQAIVEKMTIITKDDNIQKYRAKTNWLESNSSPTK